MNMGFFKKEIWEIFRTKRIIAIAAVFSFFAIMSPLTARYMGEIFAAVGGGGLDIKFPDPVYTDAWVQFFKNTTSICYIVFLLTVTGSVVSEKTKGSVMLVLSKNVSREGFIIGKFTAACAHFTIVYLLSVLFCLYYTSVLFKDATYGSLAYPLLLLWLAGVFFIAFGIFASVLAKSPTSAAIIGFAGYAALNIPTVVPEAAKYTPAGIGSIGPLMISNIAPKGDALLLLISTLTLTLIFTLLAVLTFKKQEL